MKSEHKTWERTPHIPALEGRQMESALSPLRSRR